MELFIHVVSIDHSISRPSIQTVKCIGTVIVVLSLCIGIVIVVLLLLSLLSLLVCFDVVLLQN